MGDSQAETVEESGEDATAGSTPGMMDILKAIYFDPIIWLIIFAGFLVMYATGMVPGAVVIVLFTTVYFVVRDDFLAEE